MCCCCCSCSRRFSPLNKSRCSIIITLLVALYSISLYRDRYKLRSFPAVATRFFDVGFSVSEMPNLSGKTALVTGANSGLGLESVKAMYKAGAHVVMGCRSLEKCDSARKMLMQEVETITVEESQTRVGTLTMLKLDLSSFSSVRKAAALFMERHSQLDILMLNAGGMFPHELTNDGIEMTFQVSHLSHFLLTRLLMPSLLAAESGDARVVTITSDAHHYSYKSGILGQPDLDAINNPILTSSWQNYAQSKLANILFVRELSERFQIAVSKVNINHLKRKIQKAHIYANAAHPGLVASRFIYQVFHRVLGLSETTAARADAFVESVFVSIGLYFNLEGGSLTQLFLACSPNVKRNNITGFYYVPIAGESPLDPKAQNKTLATALWTLSEKATGISFDVDDLLQSVYSDDDYSTNISSASSDKESSNLPKSETGRTISDNRDWHLFERGKMVQWTGQEYMPSQLFLPISGGSSHNKKHPILVYTHGGPPGGPAKEMNRQSLPRLLNSSDSVDPESGVNHFAKSFPFIGLFPCSLCTKEGNLRPHSELVGGPPTSGPIGWTPENFLLVDQLVRLAIRDFNGDPQRIFVTGQSYGGRGAWEYAASRPHMFAGIVPVCASLQPTPDLVSALDPRTHVWVFHGANDESSDVRQSDMWVSALRSQRKRIKPKESVRYTRYEEAPDALTATGDLYAKGHAAYELAYRDQKLWYWLAGLKCTHCYVKEVPIRRRAKHKGKKKGKRRKRRRRRKKKSGE